MIATDLHADTLRLIDTLAVAPKGEVVTLARLSDSIGRDIRHCRHLLYSALRVLERDKGVAFACVRGSGYRQLASDEIVKIGQTARSRIRHTARRSVKTMGAAIAGANDITDKMRREILAEQSVLSMMEHLSRERNLPVVPEQDTRPLPVAIVARQFLQSIGGKE